MNPTGDPYVDVAEIEDLRGKRIAVDVDVDEDDLEGLHKPLLVIALRSGDGEFETLEMIEEPAAGRWHLEGPRHND